MDSEVTIVSAATPADAHAAYGVDVASLLNGLLAMLGHEVDAQALLTTATRAALGSLGDRSAVLAAIVADADAIFPDALTRPVILGVLHSLVSAANGGRAS